MLDFFSGLLFVVPDYQVLFISLLPGMLWYVSYVCMVCALCIHGCAVEARAHWWARLAAIEPQQLFTDRCRQGAASHCSLQSLQLLAHNLLIFSKCCSFRIHFCKFTGCSILSLICLFMDCRCVWFRCGCLFHTCVVLPLHWCLIPFLKEHYIFSLINGICFKLICFWKRVWPWIHSSPPASVSPM